MLLIDEVHTPDSSRYWVADAYEERLAAGEEPESLDKEAVRRALADSGYRGDGDPPPLGADVVAATAERYIGAYERLTGEPFERGDYPVGERISARLDGIVAAHRRCVVSRDLVVTALDDDVPQEECGILGLSTPNGDGVAQLAFFGLFALQHRGQEAAGLAVSDGRRVRVHKQPGLVSNVFTREALAPLVGYHAIGHTRYSTTGGSSDRNIQPFVVETMHGPLALAHNGNIVNTTSLREELLTAWLRADRVERLRGDDADVRRGRRAIVGGPHRAHAPGVEGGVLARPAVRRPGARRARPVGLPAAVGRPSPSRRLGRRQRDLCARHPRLHGPLRGRTGRDRHAAGHGDPPPPSADAGRRGARCTFEFVYFSRPDSVWDGRNMHHVREALGVELARESAVDADVVIPVPDSSIPAAIGYARESGVPFNDGLIKNRYIGRTFIEPTQEIRQRGVALKYNSLPENLHGRRVVMIDDSLVRGTTAGPLVKLVRDAGATEVHLRITCPPIIHPCHFGVDMGHDGDLMSARLTIDETRDRIGADSLAFLSLEGMMRAIGYDDVATAGYCNACYTGDYPIAVADAQAKLSFEGVLA